jgi:hypothetical protein
VRSEAKAEVFDFDHLQVIVSSVKIVKNMSCFRSMLINQGVTDLYAAPLSMTNSKTIFVSTQLGFSYYLK